MAAREEKLENESARREAEIKQGEAELERRKAEHENTAALRVADMEQRKAELAAAEAERANEEAARDESIQRQLEEARESAREQAELEADAKIKAAEASARERADLAEAERANEEAARDESIQRQLEEARESAREQAELEADAKIKAAEAARERADLAAGAKIKAAEERAAAAIKALAAEQVPAAEKREADEPDFAFDVGSAEIDAEQMDEEDLRALNESIGADATGAIPGPTFARPPVARAHRPIAAPIGDKDALVESYVAAKRAVAAGGATNGMNKDTLVMRQGREKYIDYGAFAGKGGFAEVRLATIDNLAVALKRVHADADPVEAANALRAEANMLTSLGGEHVVMLLESGWICGKFAFGACRLVFL